MTDATSFWKQWWPLLTLVPFLFAMEGYVRFVATNPETNLQVPMIILSLTAGIAQGSVKASAGESNGWWWAMAGVVIAAFVRYVKI